MTKPFKPVPASIRVSFAVLAAMAIAPASAQLLIDGSPPAGAQPTAASEAPAAQNDADLRANVSNHLLALNLLAPAQMPPSDHQLTVAITTFQARNGLDADGLVSPGLLDTLRVAVNMQAGNGASSATGAAAAANMAGGTEDAEDPCLDQQLGEAAAATSSAGSRLRSAGNLLRRLNRNNKTLNEVANTASNVAGGTQDARHALGIDCNK